MTTTRVHGSIAVGMISMLLVVFSVCPTAKGQDCDCDCDCPTIGVTVDNTFTSRYMWRGFDLFDDHAAYQPSVDLDLFQSGFSVNMWGSIPMGTGSLNHGNGINEWQEWDYTVAYGNTLFADTCYAIDYGINYIYYDFPKLDRASDTMEVGAGISMPNLISLGDVAIVPSYYAGALWPAESGGDTEIDGWAHVFGLSADLVTAGIIPGTEEQVWSLSWDITYNDGQFAVDHDWSHTTFGLAAPVDFDVFGQTVTVTPFMNYQVSMDDSVNDENEFYGGVSVTVCF
ncbi:MAG: hypothetical protein JW936_00680 [Sedimentisphaerales bacterium]|nr:hypothetical protein [Sedimentisphaerales bacterium]